MTLEEKISVVVNAIDSKKGNDIKILKITDLSIIADCFVIASASNTTQVKAIADEVEYKLKENGVSSDRIEGYQSASWILLDYKDVVVHIFYEPTREFYSLERLWQDSAQIDASEFLEKGDK